jgi:hypothetical protein
MATGSGLRARRAGKAASKRPKHISAVRSPTRWWRWYSTAVGLSSAVQAAGRRSPPPPGLVPGEHLRLGGLAARILHPKRFGMLDNDPGRREAAGCHRLTGVILTSPALAASGGQAECHISNFGGCNCCCGSVQPQVHPDCGGRFRSTCRRDLAAVQDGRSQRFRPTPCALAISDAPMPCAFIRRT